MKRTSILLTGTLIISLLCALSGHVDAECKDWDVGDPLDGEEVTSPPNNAVYLAGALVEFVYTDPTDPDEYTTDEAGPCCPEPCIDYDGLSLSFPSWTATSGSFPVTNIGNSVDWQAPDGEVSDITVDVNDDDVPYDIDACDTPTRDDDEQLMATRTIETVIPEIVAVNFQPASASYNLKTHVDDSTVSSTDQKEYQRDFGARGPHTVHAAAFKKDTKLKAKVMVYHDDDLTESESVNVCAYASGVGTSITELSYVGATFGTSWGATTSTLESDENLDDAIGYYDDASLEWGYCVPSPGGSGTWITMVPTTEHPICVTADAPASSDARYEWVARASCKAADGQDSDDPKTIIDDIYDSLAACARVDNWSRKLRYAYPVPPPTTVDMLLDNREGSCGNMARYFCALCNVQGLNSSDGLIKGSFVRVIPYTAPWFLWVVTNKGLNNSTGPNPANYSSETVVLVNNNAYPNPYQSQVQEVAIGMWYNPSMPAFQDHVVVFLNLGDETDYLYDPSFPLASGSPAQVTWPGTGLETYDGGDNFMTNYFETSCPYLYGPIPVQYGTGMEWVHIHTDDFDLPLPNDPINPDDITFGWTTF